MYLSHPALRQGAYGHLRPACAILPTGVGLIILAWALLAPVTALSQASVSELFTGPSLNPLLELSQPGGYSYGGGGASNNTGQRGYIRTTATNFNTVDFTLMVTYTISTTGKGGDPVAFIGLGSGSPDGSYYDEPLSAVYLRSFPNDFGDGNTQMSLNDGAGNVTELTPFGSDFGIGTGTHRALLTKVGDTLTFSIDAHSSSGTFVADYSTTLSLAGDAPFLDATNSRLFIGTQDPGTTFQSMSITVVPESATVGVGAGLAVLGVAFGWRRRTQD